MKSALRIIGFGVLAFGLVIAGWLALFGTDLRSVVFAQPLGLVALAVPFVALGVRAWSSPRPVTFRFSRARSVNALRRGLAARLADMPDGLRFAAALLVAVALARPQSTRLTERVEHEGIDIVIALDLSESMEATDMYPNRLGAAQEVIDRFIDWRARDRIGLVVFGASASTISPLTMDHEVLRALVGRLRLGVIDGTRTAVGAGLGVALNRLDDSDAETQVIVLLTDGVHNAGGLDPDSVAEQAAARDVRIYTVLMGRHQLLGNQSIDPDRLERIAGATGGYAYTAEDQRALDTTFQDLLDKLERSTIEGKEVASELFPWALWPALLFLVLEVVLRSTRLRRFP